MQAGACTTALDGARNDVNHSIWKGETFIDHSNWNEKPLSESIENTAAIQGEKVASLEGENIHQYVFPSSGFIIFGNESEGIRNSVKDVLTAQVKIPNWGHAESLNVAISAGVILDNIRRQN